MGDPLHNYIRTFRRRAFMSQNEVAFLLGTGAATSVVRHEADQRVPTLETALCYAALFQVDPRELFAGRYEAQVRLVQGRAAELMERAQEQLPTPDVEEKLAHLEGLAAAGEPRVIPWAE